MYRPHLISLLLLAGGTYGSDCRVVTGPDGLCAELRLDPTRADLDVGGTLRVHVRGLDCIDGGRRRMHWRSSAPRVAEVDSTGLVHARAAGVADISLEVGEPTAGAPEELRRMRVIVGG